MTDNRKVLGRMYELLTPSGRAVVDDLSNSPESWYTFTKAGLPVRHDLALFYDQQGRKATKEIMTPRPEWKLTPSDLGFLRIIITEINKTP